MRVMAYQPAAFLRVPGPTVPLKTLCQWGDLIRARTLLVSGSIRNVSPVASLDGTDVTLGPVSLEMQRVFQERAADDVDP